MTKLLSEKSAEDEKLDTLQQLPEHERNILEQQLEAPAVRVTYTSLYRYATGKEILIISLSALAAIIAGATTPLMTVSKSSMTFLFLY